MTYENTNKLFQGRQKVLINFKNKEKPMKNSGTGIKILKPKQMLQRIPIALAQIQTSNTLENLPNEIKQIVYSLYWAKETTTKVYSNMIKHIYYLI